MEGNEEDLALFGSEIDFSIGVKTISVRGFWRSFINVLVVPLEGLSDWALEELFAFNEWEELNVIEEIILHNGIKIGSAKNSIPIISNVTTIHDITEQVTEIEVWNLWVLGQVVVENITANSEITIIEIIGSGPSLRSELLPTEDQRVEHAKSEQ